MAGDFWARVDAQYRRALAAGALQPVATDVVRAEGFELRVATALEHKPPSAAPGAKDPFLPPYEPALLVGDVSPTHVCLLNKFPVFPRHALLVTRAFEPQEAWLTRADCEALLPALESPEVLAFYNGGRGAGASQPHKHLQVVPLCPPLDARIAQGQLPFRHVVQRTPATPEAFQRAHEEALRALGVAPGAPWNLLATREWLLVVPRAAEAFEGISLNALAFAGSLFARSPALRQRLVDAGPWRVLQAVTAG